MAKQVEEEGWDFFKFQEELIDDFALYEQEYLAPYPGPEFAFDDPQQLDLDDMIECLKTGQNPEPNSPPHPPRVEEQVDIIIDESRKCRNEKEFITGLEENERFLVSEFPNTSFQRILFEIYVTDNHVSEEIKDCTTTKGRKKVNTRAASRRSYDKKKKHIEDVCLQIEKLRMENKMRKKVVKFLEISKEVGTFPRRLARATSGPLPSY